MCNVYLSNNFAVNVFNTVYVLRDRIASGECLNFVTGKSFGNKNSEILTTECQFKKYPSNCWATFKQIQTIGGSVKGQHGITITLVMKKEETEEDKAIKPLKTAGKETIIKRITVFNLSQIHDARLDHLTKEQKEDLNGIDLGQIENLQNNLQAVDLKVASVEIENKMNALENGVKAIENKEENKNMPVIEITEEWGAKNIEGTTYFVDNRKIRKPKKAATKKPVKKATTKSAKKATVKATKKPNVDPLQKAINDFDNFVAGL